jgi:hypothetical protein
MSFKLQVFGDEVTHLGMCLLMFTRGTLPSPQGSGSKADSSGTQVLTNSRGTMSHKSWSFITSSLENQKQGFFITMFGCSYTHNSTVVCFSYCVCAVPIGTGRVVAQVDEALHHKTGVPGPKIFKWPIYFVSIHLPSVSNRAECSNFLG